MIGISTMPEMAPVGKVNHEYGPLTPASRHVKVGLSGMNWYMMLVLTIDTQAATKDCVKPVRSCQCSCHD